MFCTELILQVGLTCGADILQHVAICCEDFGRSHGRIWCASCVSQDRQRSIELLGPGCVFGREPIRFQVRRKVRQVPRCSSVTHSHQICISLLQESLAASYLDQWRQIASASWGNVTINARVVDCGLLGCNAMKDPEGGGSMFRRNVGIYL